MCSKSERVAAANGLIRPVLVEVHPVIELLNGSVSLRIEWIVPELGKPML
jgi:hypothetical protein